MSTKDLIAAIEAGNADAIQTTFESEMATRIADRLTEMRASVAKNMFAPQIEEEVEQIDELSSATMNRYVDKAEDSYSKTKDPKVKAKRDAGLDRAEDKLERRANSGNPFKEEVDLDEEDGKKLHPDHVHVSKAPGNKYKVHAVGSNFSHGLKVGEHVNDTHLDDLGEMGAHVKMIKAPK